MKISAIDFFCGVGGLTHGLQRAGINVVAGIDIDSKCQYPYDTNNNALFINKSVKDVSSEEIRSLYAEDELKVLVGCAPCQPFSNYSNNKLKKDGKVDSKWGLLYSFGEIVKEVKPEIVSMENVPQMTKEKVFTDFVDLLKELKYYVFWDIVYAPDYGIPQNRKRLVLLASRIKEISLIPPINSKNEYPNVRDAIGHLPAILAGEACENDPLHKSSKLNDINIKRIRQSKPGGTWRDWDDNLKLECHTKDSGKSYASVYGRMKWDKPSPTITTQFYGYGNGRFGHPEQDRALSLREGALLQTFPEDYKFIDPNNKPITRDIGVYIGNAVPVKLAEAIGISIRKHLEG